MNKGQKTFIPPATWAMKIILCLNILNASSIFSKPQFKEEQESKQFANDASVPMANIPVVFYGATPTLNWPEWGWPNDNRCFCCIVFMQSKWHSSGPFPCNAPSQICCYSSYLWDWVVSTLALSGLSDGKWTLILVGRVMTTWLLDSHSPLFLHSLSSFSLTLKKCLWAMKYTQISMNIFI